VIEISLDREEAINLDIEVGALGPMYEDTQCNMDVGTTYKWGDIYYMFKEETYPELPLVPSEENIDVGVYQQIKKSRLHKIEARHTILPHASFISWLINKVYI